MIHRYEIKELAYWRNYNIHDSTCSVYGCNQNYWGW